MQLELATTEDIVNELLGRPVRFALVVVDDTNTQRPLVASFSGKGMDCQEVADLFDMGREAFERHDPDDHLPFDDFSGNEFP